MIRANEAYTFDDLMLVPQHSEVKSRKDPDVTVRAGLTSLQIPVIASPMNTVTEAEMIRTMASFGGAAVLHRYMSIERQLEICKEIIEWGTVDDASDNAVYNALWVAVGANGDLEHRIRALMDIGIGRYCVDVANGHSVMCIDAVKTIKKVHPAAIVMAGNVCSADGAYRLADIGTDLIRVGIGPGSVCTTRLVTGHGVPQLSAIDACVRAVSMFPDCGIVADGGIRSSGDVVKALAMGADMVMLGGVLAGTSDTPGETHKDPSNGMLYKYYHGMASEAARESWFERSKTSFVPEGESTKIPYKGDTGKILEGLVDGLRVGMSYTGARDLEELRERADWVRVSNAGMIEGTPHGKRP